MKEKLLKVLFTTLLFIGLFTLNTKADYYSEFQVIPKLPSNQREGVEGYYDLLLKPNDLQTIQIDIKNHGDQDMEAVVDITQSTTGANGSKQYMDEVENDNSLKYPMNQVVTLENRIVNIKKGETKTVDINIKMPQEAIEGVLLGGIRVYSNDNLGANSNENINIDNRINYIVAMQLRNDDQTYQENLNLIDFGGKLESFVPAFFANIQNDKAILMNNLNISGSISKMNSDVIIKDINFTDKSIVPNSNFNVIFDLGNEPMKAGNYDLYLKIESEENVWEWNESFTIQAEESKQLNKESVLPSTTNWTLILIIGLIFIILLLLFILFFIIFKRRKEEEEEEDVIINY